MGDNKGKKRLESGKKLQRGAVRLKRRRIFKMTCTFFPMKVRSLSGRKLVGRNGSKLFSFQCQEMQKNMRQFWRCIVSRKQIKMLKCKNFRI